MRIDSSRQVTRSTPEEGGGSPGLDDEKAVQRYLMKTLRVPREAAEELLAMPDEVRDKLFRYFDLAVRHGFDSRQVATYGYENKDLHPLFNKYAALIQRSIVKNWKDRS